MEKKLKIGMTCYPTTGGSGIVATELGHALAELGHEVHFISYGIPFRLDLSRPQVYFHEVVVNSYPLFKYVDYSLPLSVKMAEVSEEYDLDILHVHYAVPHATAAFLAKQMLGRERCRPRVITTLHGTDVTLMSQDVHYKPIIRYSIEKSCGVTAVSESLKKQTQELFGITKPIEVIHNFAVVKPVTQSREDIRRHLGLKTEEILVVHGSNLRDVKRIPDLLTMLSKCPDQRIKLLILAGGSFSAYEELAQDLKVRDRVIVKEQVLDVENYFNAADVGAYTSDKESFGLSILETMTYGHPVLGTDAGGIPEVISHGETGWIYPVGDTDAMAEGLMALAGDQALRERMGKKGQERAMRVFSKERIVQHYLNFYRSIMKNCP